MRNKTSLAIFCIITVLVVFHSQARSRVNIHRADYTHRLHAAALPLPVKVIRALAGEFNGLVADYLVLEAASFIGSPQSFDAGEDDWAAVTRLLDQSSYLDPYFKHTYRLAQSVLPWQTKKTETTLTILERSRAHLPWDWEPGFYMGFDHHFFLKDNLTASQLLMETSQIEGAPLMLATLGSRLASKAGQVQTGIDFLVAMYTNTKDEVAKQTLEDRIVALKGVLALQWAIDQFEAQFSRQPHSLDELVERSIIPSLPANPYDRPYSLEDGRVNF